MARVSLAWFSTVLVLMAFVSGCKKDSTQPMMYWPVPDLGITTNDDAGMSDAGVDLGYRPEQNLGADVPVDIAWIVPIQGRIAGSPWPAFSVRSMAVDASGNTYLAGDRFGTYDVDPGPGVSMVTTAQDGRPSLTKFDANGHFVWTKVWPQVRGSQRDPVVRTAPDGTVLLGGTFSAELNAQIDFDPSDGVDNKSSGGIEEMFLSRFSPDGTYLSTWITSDAGIVELADMQIASNGDIWFTGSFTGSPDFDPTSSRFYLHAPSSTSSTFPAFLARWTADGQFAWAEMLNFIGIYSLNPLDDGGAVFGGVFGGGTSDMPQGPVDLDPGPGIDARNAQGSYEQFWTRIDDQGIPSWLFSFQDVDVTRINERPEAIGGNVIATPSGDGMLFGQFNSNVDFDWGPAQTRRYNPRHDGDGGHDGCVVRFDAQGNFVHVQQDVSQTGFASPADMRFGSRTYVASTHTFYATGWTDGALIFGTGSVGGIGTPMEGFVAAFDEDGRTRWAAGLDISLEAGGSGPLLVSAANGLNVMLGTFAGTVDLDFTHGVDLHTATGPLDYYLVGFKERACTSGQTHACNCIYDTSAAPASCVNGRFETCACPERYTGDTDPTPDCGPCPTGWTCDTTTWLCKTADRVELATALNHPLETLDDGTYYYFVLEGTYSAMPSASNYSLWRMDHDGMNAEMLEGTGHPSFLTADRGYVYWANGGGLHRTPVGGDGTIEVVIDSGVDGPIAFDPDSYYYGSGINNVRRHQRDGTGFSNWGTYAGTIRQMSADTYYVYLIADGYGSSEYSGLYRLSIASWGTGHWTRVDYSLDPQSFIDTGTYLYTIDRGDGGVIRRTPKSSWLPENVIIPFGGTLGASTISGDYIYFTLWGFDDAWDWSSEVHRLHIDTMDHELVATGFSHIADVDVSNGRLIVTDHGSTRATTNLGKIVSLPIP